MKTRNGIPCNETQFTPGADRCRITYRFVAGDRDIPGSCTVRLGDTDPVTGTAITEVDFFREYYRIEDQQIHGNLKAIRPEYTQEQKARREAEKQAFRESFLAEYGYVPSRDDIQYHLSESEPNRYSISIDEMTNEEGENMTDRISDFACWDVDPFGTDLNDDLYALSELAATFTGRRKDVYEAMLDGLAGGAGRTTNTELARRWGVTEGQIRKDRKQIVKMIKEKICG